MYQWIPVEHYKINTALWKNQPENMLTENVYYIQRNLYIYIYIYMCVCVCVCVCVCLPL